MITTQDQYPSDVKFGALKDKSEQLENVNVGDLVVVKFDVKGREYNDKYYVDLNAWRIEKQGAEAGAPQGGQPAQNAGDPAQQAPAPAVAAAPAPAMSTAAGSDEDLPF